MVNIQMMSNTYMAFLVILSFVFGLVNGFTLWDVDGVALFLIDGLRKEICHHRVSFELS